MLAVILETTDFIIIALIVIIFAGGSTVYTSQGASKAEVKRVQEKLDHLIRHLDVPTPECPKCGFAYKWDGDRCEHCGYTRGEASAEQT